MSERLIEISVARTPREKRREAILEAAETCFIEQGYDRTSLADIVKLSGGSLMTLYELFGDKQGLLHAVAARWRDQTTQARAVSYCASGQSNVDILMSYVKREREIMRSTRAVALIRILVSECLRDRDFALQTYADLHLPVVKELSDLLAGWSAAGSAEIDDPLAAAHLFFSTISGDSMLNAMAGIEDAILDEEQARWRLRPFLAYFKIADNTA